MKRFWVFLVLLAHINFGMFIPHVDEADQFDVHNSRLDDINSLYEYIDECVLGNPDHTPEDEDDDQGKFYNILKHDPFSFQQSSIYLKRPYCTLKGKNRFPDYLLRKLPLIPTEVCAPPPDQC